jgi:hypothetical protein
MANYTATNGSTASAGTQQSITTTYVSPCLSVGAPTTAPHRGKIYDLLIGTNGTPADNAVEWDISRITTVSTAVAAGTLITPQPLDPADGAATTVVTVNSTGSPTISIQNIFYVGVNQRASYRWVAAPGSELVWPATSSNGFALRARSPGYTGTVTGNWMFQEQ